MALIIGGTVWFGEPKAFGPCQKFDGTAGMVADWGGGNFSCVDAEQEAPQLTSVATEVPPATDAYDV